jgi:hypothetical protein
MEGDSIYFGRRASEERIAAMKAPHPRARKAHLELADRYDDLATAIVSRDRRDRHVGQVLDGAAKG